MESTRGLPSPSSTPPSSATATNIVGEVAQKSTGPGTRVEKVEGKFHITTDGVPDLKLDFINNKFTLDIEWKVKIKDGSGSKDVTKKETLTVTLPNDQTLTEEQKVASALMIMKAYRRSVKDQLLPGTDPTDEKIKEFGSTTLMRAKLPDFGDKTPKTITLGRQFDFLQPRVDKKATAPTIETKFDRVKFQAAKILGARFAVSGAASGVAQSPLPSRARASTPASPAPPASSKPLTTPPSRPSTSTPTAAAKTATPPVTPLTTAAPTLSILSPPPSTPTPSASPAPSEVKTEPTSSRIIPKKTELQFERKEGGTIARMFKSQEQEKELSGEEVEFEPYDSDDEGEEVKAEVKKEEEGYFTVEDSLEKTMLKGATSMERMPPSEPEDLRPFIDEIDQNLKAINQNALNDLDKSKFTLVEQGLRDERRHLRELTELVDTKKAPVNLKEALKKINKALEELEKDLQALIRKYPSKS